jgi:WD40 repeat protein
MDRNVDTVLEGEPGAVYGLAYSPDGATLAAARFDGTVTLWDTKSWQVRREFRAESRALRSLAFSPHGALLATAGWDSTIALWDTATWRARTVLRGHTRLVTCVRFAPDGRTLASASTDETVRLWDVSSGRSERVLRPYFPEEQQLSIASPSRPTAGFSPHLARGAGSSSGTRPMGTEGR